jgi:type IV pilus biogenesis protein CpaD/CtpE
MKIIILSILIILLSGCSNNEKKQDDDSIIIYETDFSIVKRIEDKENNVICYTFKYGYAGGIDCIELKNK